MRAIPAEVGRWNRRFRIELDDGAAVEAVLYREDTLCISSQVGCAVGCPFCASGANGFARNLGAAELIGQVTAVRALGHDVARVTVSGVGEPLHNIDAVDDLVRWCRDHRIGPSLTTSGGPTARLARALALPHNGLTISTHAGTEETRARMVPRGPTLAALFDTLAAELPHLSRSRRRKVALAYLVLRDANDADAELDAFADRVLPLALDVHLYAYNPVPTSAHAPVPRARYEAIYERLTHRGLRVRMSSQARLESNGGCGTLIARNKGTGTKLHATKGQEPSCMQLSPCPQIACAPIAGRDR